MSAAAYKIEQVREFETVRPPRRPRSRVSIASTVLVSGHAVCAVNHQDFGARGAPTRVTHNLNVRRLCPLPCPDAFEFTEGLLSLFSHYDKGATAGGYERLAWVSTNQVIQDAATGTKVKTESDSTSGGRHVE